ncbi:PAS domain-containing protein [Mucilaginibacter antarcticus]|uniref:PAS domain-containing protein n=1 Tax=Mucilaginibacter antarcticus TaxID=1855725 RepID=UPI00362C0DDE
MRVQRYDVPDVLRPGKFIQRYWDPCHTPVLDQEGDISYIIQLATDVTDKILAEQALYKSNMEQVETTEQIKSLNTELLATNVELRDTQQKLTLLNSKLEERVAKRTQELKRANEEQAAINERAAATNKELTEIQQRLIETNREVSAIAARLRISVESTGLGSWEYNPTTGNLFWSKECRQIFGLTEEQEVDFDTYTRHIHPDDQEWVIRRISETLQPDSSGKHELTHRILRFDNNELRWVKAKGTVEFEQGVATCFWEQF